MLKSLTKPELVETASQEISALLREYAEWLFVCDSVSNSVAQSLRRDEIEVVVMRNRLLLSCWTEQGTRLWRVVAWDWNGQLLELEVSTRVRIQLIPRTSAKAITATIRAARQMRCERLARLAAASHIGSVVEQLSLRDRKSVV